MVAKSKSSNPVMLAVVDGLGLREETCGNALSCAYTPNLDYLRESCFYKELYAHGPWVGLGSQTDMGNSEVGHNTMGAGRVYDQGAKLVANAVKDKSIFLQDTWKELVDFVDDSSSLHFIGLLSDGNIHSHNEHLHAMLEQAVKQGIKKIRIHILLDGRDTPARSAMSYANKLENKIEKLQNLGADIQVASGGGRMSITMDRYEADWQMVERGWRAHVLGEAKSYTSLRAALEDMYKRFPDRSDQFLPEFVIEKDSKPVGTIEDGDGVVFFNFRGDRSIEISRAFEEESFAYFDRIRVPKVFYCGMLEYDGDKHIPKHFLVSSANIKNTLGEHLASLGLRQFACSETQKFGHVTYFWNGNKSGYFDEQLEEYLEIASDKDSFDKAPWMKAADIVDASIDRIKNKTFDFARINFANPDMVGHTGDFQATVLALSSVDLMLGRLLRACKDHGVSLIVVADHGNCEDMFSSSKLSNNKLNPFSLPSSKNSHTISKVPFSIYDPSGKYAFKAANVADPSLANIANSILFLLNLEQQSSYAPSLIV
jgi:2,3-bisphosphoglycerate-independent phosphoglycerate mutase